MKALAFVGLLVLAGIAVACAAPPTTPSSSLGGPPVSDAPSSVALTVLAAASLTDAGAELEAAYEDATPAVDLTWSFDSSSALRGQVEAGAAADVFLSADAGNPESLEEGGLTVGAQVPFASNLLTIVVPSDNPGGVESWTDLATDGLRIVAAGEDVPIQQYADEVIANLDTEADAPDGYAQAVAANVVSREDNVRAVLARIELGEGDAAIVYVTDAMSSPDVTAIGSPTSRTCPRCTWAWASSPRLTKWRSRRFWPGSWTMRPRRSWPTSGSRRPRDRHVGQDRGDRRRGLHGAAPRPAGRRAARPGRSRRPGRGVARGNRSGPGNQPRLHQRRACGDGAPGHAARVRAGARAPSPARGSSSRSWTCPSSCRRPSRPRPAPVARPPWADRIGAVRRRPRVCRSQRRRS